MATQRTCIGCGIRGALELCEACAARLPEHLRVPRWRNRDSWVRRVRERLGHPSLAKCSRRGEPRSRRAP